MLQMCFRQHLTPKCAEYVLLHASSTMPIFSIICFTLLLEYVSALCVNHINVGISKMNIQS